MSDPVLIDYESDWETRLLGKLFTQFRDAESWQLWVTDVIAPQIQDLERAFQSILTILDIDNSEGAQLDTIGRIVGQPRSGLADATYRTYLRARIQANRSDGSSEELYDVFKALYGSTIGMIATTSDIGVKAFALRIKGAITAAQASAGVDFLRDAKETAARGILEWQESDDSLMFCFSGGSGLGFNQGNFAGAKQA